MGLFSRPRGFTQEDHPIYYEMKEWAKAGLIPDFGPASLADPVIVSVLNVVREHLTDAKTEA
jgi:hypothetical protein